MIWCTVLNPTLDVVYRTNEFHSGATFLNQSHIQQPAGKGLNVAQIIVELGEAVTVIGLLPELDEQKFRAFLDVRSIRNRFLPVAGAMRINATIIDEVENRTTHLNALAQKVSPRIQHEFFELAAGEVKSGDTWIFSGSLPPGFSESTYADFVTTVREAGGITVLDSRGSALQHGVRSRPLMVKPNLAELEEFFGEPVQGVHHIALKGKRLLDMGISYVFISLGADGMIALHGNDCLLCNAPQVTVKDTVGCGDALVAGMVVAHRRQFSFSETCRMAVACGTAKSLEFGPGHVSRETVWQLMEDVEITSI